MKKILTLCLAAALMCSVPAMPANAVSDPVEQTVSSENQIKATGLIKSFDLSVSASGKTLYINGATTATDAMKSIGYKDIAIEFSSNGVNWYTEKNIDDLLISNSYSYHLNDYAVSVNGGFYYRVSCNHYAKAKGLLGGSQSEPNSSNSVWINY
ncbi:MAG: hypothetical protein NC340_08795 [Ruminococcus flavefaciens]|nr:hypothetical protein [Ruminococcus flavefaciens]MCM1230580.1 hypothetical protein [Ruminococcus flavefaciens]